MRRRLSMMVVRMTVRIVIVFNRYRQHIGQITFRNLFLKVLLDVVVEFMESQLDIHQLITAMIWIQKLLSMLSRQVGRLRVASVIIGKIQQMSH